MKITVLEQWITKSKVIAALKLLTVQSLGEFVSKNCQRQLAPLVRISGYVSSVEIEVAKSDWNAIISDTDDIDNTTRCTRYQLIKQQVGK